MMYFACEKMSSLEMTWNTHSAVAEEGCTIHMPLPKLKVHSDG